VNATLHNVEGGLQIVVVITTTSSSLLATSTSRRNNFYLHEKNSSLPLFTIFEFYIAPELHVSLIGKICNLQQQSNLITNSSKSNHHSSIARWKAERTELI
jgi:hypothetical protein